MCEAAAFCSEVASFWHQIAPLSGLQLVNGKSRVVAPFNGDACVMRDEVGQWRGAWNENE